VKGDIEEFAVKKNDFFNEKAALMGDITHEDLSVKGDFIDEGFAVKGGVSDEEIAVGNDSFKGETEAKGDIVHEGFAVKGDIEEFAVKKNDFFNEKAAVMGDITHEDLWVNGDMIDEDFAERNDTFKEEAAVKGDIVHEGFAVKGNMIDEDFAEGNDTFKEEAAVKFPEEASGEVKADLTAALEEARKEWEAELPGKMQTALKIAGVLTQADVDRKLDAMLKEVRELHAEELEAQRAKLDLEHGKEIKEMNEKQNKKFAWVANLVVGQRVALAGLGGNNQIGIRRLNSMTGWVERFHRESGRFDVLLDEENEGMKSVKPKNLVLIKEEGEEEEEEEEEEDKDLEMSGSHSSAPSTPTRRSSCEMMHCTRSATNTSQPLARSRRSRTFSSEFSQTEDDVEDTSSGAECV